MRPIQQILRRTNVRHALQLAIAIPLAVSLSGAGALAQQKRTPPQNQNQVNDIAAWMGGKTVGELADSYLNPILN